MINKETTYKYWFAIWVTYKTLSKYLTELCFSLNNTITKTKAKEVCWENLIYDQN